MCNLAQSIIFLFVWLVLAVSPWKALGQPACDALFTRADSLYNANWVPWGTAVEGVDAEKARAFEEVIRLAPAARSCYAGRDSTRAIRMWQREIYAHFALRQRVDFHAKCEAFFNAYDGRTEPGWIGFVHWLRGFVRACEGRGVEAASDYAKAIELMANNSVISRSLLHADVGTALADLHDYTSAHRHFDEADRLITLTDRTDSPVITARAKALFYRSDALISELGYKGDESGISVSEIEKLARESVALLRTIDLLPDLPRALTHLGEVLVYQNKIDEARHVFLEAEALAKQLNDPDALSTARVKHGRMYLKLREWDKAEQLFTMALRVVTNGGIRTESVRRALLALADLYELQGAYDRAEAFFRRAADVTEARRLHLGVSHWSAVAFGRWQASAHLGLVRVLLAQGREEEAFVVLEESRARHIQDVRRASTYSRLSFEERRRLEQVSRDLSDIRSQIATVEGDTERSRMLAEEMQLAAVRTGIFGEAPKAHSISVRKVQASLGSRVLISYFIRSPDGIQEGPGPSFAFVVTADTFAAVPLPHADSETVRQLMSQVSPVLIHADTVSFSTTQFNVEALYDLYEAVFAPVAPLIPTRAPIVIVPDGPLFNLPFAALVEDEVAPYDYASAAFLAKKHAVSVVLGSGMIESSPGHREFAIDIAAFGRSTYSGIEITPAGDYRERSHTTTVLDDLPGVRSELDAIRRLFWRVRVGIDEGATEETFREAMKQARVVHVASHAVANATAPLESALYLSPGPESDGVIRFHELLDVRARPDLVVLSACRTADGERVSGEGVLGLFYAFQAMGARASLATLWTVSDAATADLFPRFYEHVRRGAGADEALRLAQLDYLAQAQGWALSPYFWASPVLYGNAMPLDLEPQYAGLSPTWWIFVGVCFGVGFAVVAVVRPRFRRRMFRKREDVAEEVASA